ncbi:MAG: GNAT family N-acetyltransferase [Cyanobacteria bacterium SIG26]|nr:GNAT family N-acetyltransferase [Cyanobacteria bacterium SIG26]
MCKFIQMDLSAGLQSITSLRYIPDVKKCCHKFLSYLQDDFSVVDKSDILGFIQKNSPYFWLILDNLNDEFMGFVYLDNFVGNEKLLFSAELTTCFDRKAWGNFTRYSAKFFLKKCFDEFGLYKIKAQIYPDNFRVKTLLKSCGFKKESVLKNETLRLDKLQDIEVYSLYRDYYYKTR